MSTEIYGKEIVPLFIRKITLGNPDNKEDRKEAWGLYIRGNRFKFVENETSETIEEIESRVLEIAAIDGGYVDPTTLQNYTFGAKYDLGNSAKILLKRIGPELVGDPRVAKFCGRMLTDLKPRKA